MESKHYEVETVKPFSESLIWQLNRDFYNTKGIDAWRKNMVPHHLTSNSMTSKTYAELIFAFLKDLAKKGHTQEKVYIIELGAGHGRMAFHTLKHLERLTAQKGLGLPSFCYVLSDIVEDNLNFFHNHPQFQSYYKRGILDLTYFDAVGSQEMQLRHSGIKVSIESLNVPLIAIANYFFDSIPTDLFYFKDKKISACSVSLKTSEDPEGMDSMTLLEKMKIDFYHDPLSDSPYYKQAILNNILEDYKDLLSNSYLFFPRTGLNCIKNLKQLSKKGMLLLSMDKGFHEIKDLKKIQQPEMITHGSMSFWVNYHAYGAYCNRLGGKSFFPSFSTFHLELGCMLFLSDSEDYIETTVAYQRFVNDFGPDDFNGFKKLTYRHIAQLNLLELIGLIRLGAHDSTFFINILPRLKQVSQQITFNERDCLAQTMHQVWDMYFTLNESDDLAFEIGGMFYALGFYQEALDYFQHSISSFGKTADVYYNQALCFYHLRQDALFLETVKEAKKDFPEFKQLAHLDTLDLNA